jgi:hypothetical protein
MTNQTNKTIQECRENIQAFADRFKLIFDEAGEVGIGRECVGLRNHSSFVEFNPVEPPEYGFVPEYYDERLFDIRPENGYHKFDCLAVLGRGDDAIRELSEWVDKLNSLNAVVETRSSNSLSVGSMLFGGGPSRVSVVRIPKEAEGVAADDLKGGSQIVEEVTPKLPQPPPPPRNHEIYTRTEWVPGMQWISKREADDSWTPISEQQFLFAIQDDKYQFWYATPVQIDPVMGVPTEKYLHCNHHHEISDRHELVDFGDGELVANKDAIPLLKALNEIGLRTRSHHIDGQGHAWVCILLDGVEIEINDVFERDATRTKYNGKKEILIRWNRVVK